MKTDDATLSDICKPAQQQFKASGEATAFLNEQRDQLKITTIPWADVEEKIVEQLVGLFHIKLLDIWLSAWKECRELKQFADREKYPPDKPIQVPLAEHEIVSEHHPRLEIDVAGVMVYRLKFDLIAKLNITGCELTIQGGRIKKVLVGKCAGVATLEWEKQLLLKTETNAVQFGQEIDLGDGIALSSFKTDKATDDY